MRGLSCCLLALMATLLGGRGAGSQPIQAGNLHLLTANEHKLVLNRQMKGTVYVLPHHTLNINPNYN